MRLHAHGHLNAHATWERSTPPGNTLGSGADDPISPPEIPLTRTKLQFVPLDRSRATTRLLWITCGLTLAHATAAVLRVHALLPPDLEAVRTMFDLGARGSVGTWFCSLLLMAAGALMLLIGKLTAGVPRRVRLHWFGLGVGCCLLSIVEVAGLRSAVAPTSGGAAAGWALVLAILVPFLRSLPARTSRGLLLAGAAFLGGAAWVEAASLAQQLTTAPLERALLIGAASTLRACAAVVTLHVLLEYIAVELGGASVWVDVGSQDPAPAAAAPHARPRPAPGRGVGAIRSEAA